MDAARAIASLKWYARGCFSAFLIHSINCYCCMWCVVVVGGGGGSSGSLLCVLECVYLSFGSCCSFIYYFISCTRPPWILFVRKLKYCSFLLAKKFIIAYTSLHSTDRENKTRDQSDNTKRTKKKKIINRIDASECIGRFVCVRLWMCMAAITSSTMFNQHEEIINSIYSRAHEFIAMPNAPCRSHMQSGEDKAKIVWLRRTHSRPRTEDKHFLQQTAKNSQKFSEILTTVK